MAIIVLVVPFRSSICFGIDHPCEMFLSLSLSPSRRYLSSLARFLARYLNRRNRRWIERGGTWKDVNRPDWNRV